MTNQELGLNNLLYRDTSTPDVNTVINADGTTSTVSAVSGSSAVSNTPDTSNETNPDTVVSGELAGNLVMLDGFIRSKNYIALTSGWSINADGTAEFVSVTLSGGGLKYGKTGFTDTTHSGYYLGSEGVYFGAASDASKLKYDIGTGVFDFIGTVSGRSTLTLSNSINASGQLITDIINARIDTSAKTILDSFTFGVSGAIQIGSYVNGVSGDIKISPNGIVGRNSAGVNTFALDATTGEITSFSLTAGTITGVTITGGTLQTATSGKRLVLTGSTFQGYNSAGNGTLTISGDNAQIYAFADGAMPAAQFFVGDYVSNSANVVDISGNGTSGMALNIIGNSNTNDNLVSITAGSGAKNLLYVSNSVNTGYTLARFYQNDLDKTGVLITQDSGEAINNIGLVQINDYTGGLDCLEINNAHGHAHIRFTGGGTNNGSLTISDSYSETNRDGDFYLSSAEKLAVSQSFTPSFTGKIGLCKLFCKKLGSPTGNIVVKIFAHTGVYGTNSQPTGAALATSDNVNITTLTTTRALISFTFSGAQQISLTSGTNYVAVVFYSGGDGSNDLYVGSDNSSPTALGNSASSTDGTTFTGDYGRDIPFYIYQYQLQDGQLWYDGVHLYFQKGASTITIT